MGVFNGTKIVPVPGPTLVERLTVRRNWRDTTNTPQVERTEKGAAITRRMRAVLSKHPLPNGDITAAVRNLSNNFDSGTPDSVSGGGDSGGSGS